MADVTPDSCPPRCDERKRRRPSRPLRAESRTAHPVRSASGLSLRPQGHDAVHGQAGKAVVAADQDAAPILAHGGEVVVPAGNLAEDVVFESFLAARDPFSRSSSLSRPPSCAHGGMMLTRLLLPRVYG